MDFDNSKTILTRYKNTCKEFCPISEIKTTYGQINARFEKKLTFPDLIHNAGIIENKRACYTV